MTWLPDAVVDHLRSVATWPELPPERYEILRPLGRGGMGAVYAANDTLLDREVAIKVSNSAHAESGLDERLRAEARVLARLEHPGVVPVHDAGRLGDGRLFYVMKLVRGETLTQHAAGLEGESGKLAVFERIAEAVAFAHAAGIVHLDLAPGNVMIGSFGEVLVLDWGIAKAVGSAGATGLRVGTPAFMAPEQRGGDNEAVGPPADVYALGALLFWLLAGATAPGDGDSAARTLSALTVPPPKRLRAVILRCLAASPADRYPHAGDVVADLARYRAGHAVLAYRETWLDRAGRWFGRYRTFILLVLAYLLMRTLFAFLQR
jgi:serine/threonine protein kinase